MRITAAINCTACRIGMTATFLPSDGKVCTHDHMQALLVDRRHRLVNVDVGMVHAVTSLWSAGVQTFASCQGVESLEEYKVSGLSRPYVLISHDQIDLAMTVLADIGLPWVPELVFDEEGNRMPCLVPQWAADYAREQEQHRRQEGA